MADKSRSCISITTDELQPIIGGKLIIILFFIVFGWNVSFSQNVSINNTGALPNVSSLLDIDAAPGNNKGLLIPRIPLASATDAVTITTPATSLIVYNNGAGALLPAGYWYNSGTPASPLWVQLLHSGLPAASWLLLGNTGSTPSTSAIGTAIGAGQNYVGTRDAKDFVIGTTNLERMRVTATGNVGIGTITPNVSSSLDITATNKGLLIPRVPLTSTTDAVTIATPATSLIVYNNGAGALLPAGYWYNSGTAASPLWVQLLNGGSPGTAWLLLGNTNTTPSTSPIGTAIGAGQHYVGTKDAKDFVIGTTNLERMRVTSAGNIGIGVASPSAALHVKATSNPVRFEGLQSGTTLDSLLTVDGTGVIRRMNSELPDASFGAANLIVLAQGGTNLNFGNGDWANNTYTNFVLNSVTDLKAAYNAATGVFTVPANGFYTFAYVMELVNFPTPDAFNGNSGELRTYLSINNNTYVIGSCTQIVFRGRTITLGVVSYTASGTGTVYLKKNDTARLQFHTYGTANMNSVANNIYFDKSASALRIWQH